MRKSLPSYEHIKDKYKNGQILSPVEIGRGIVFLLIEELADDDLQNVFVSDKTNLDSGEFYSTMLQNLTELSKQHLDSYEMVYYTTVMVCCIRCLVHERRYYIEVLSTNITACRHSKQQLEQIDFIDKAISETKDKALIKTLKKIKATCLKNISPLKNDLDYKEMSLVILSNISAIYKFAEIISFNWEIPELARLFYSSSKKISYDTWLKFAIRNVNKHMLTKIKLDISEIIIPANHAKMISQLLEGRYLDISRLDAFIKALKDGIGLTISGGSQ